MYKLGKLPPSVPYACTGRVYKKPETKLYYELIKTKIKTAPDWLQEWSPGMFVKLSVQYIFANTNHADPENLNKALVNGITQAIQRWNEHFDDKYIYIVQSKPMIAKKESVIFSMEIESEEAA